MKILNYFYINYNSEVIFREEKLKNLDGHDNNYWYLAQYLSEGPYRKHFKDFPYMLISEIIPTLYDNRINLLATKIYHKYISEDSPEVNSLALICKIDSLGRIIKMTEKDILIVNNLIKEAREDPWEPEPLINIWDRENYKVKFIHVNQNSKIKIVNKPLYSYIFKQHKFPIRDYFSVYDKEDKNSQDTIITEHPFEELEKGTEYQIIIFNKERNTQSGDIENHKSPNKLGTMFYNRYGDGGSEIGTIYSDISIVKVDNNGLISMNNQDIKLIMKILKKLKKEN